MRSVRENRPWRWRRIVNAADVDPLPITAKYPSTHNLTNEKDRSALRARTIDHPHKATAAYGDGIDCAVNDRRRGPTSWPAADEAEGRASVCKRNGYAYHRRPGARVYSAIICEELLR